MPLNLRTAGVYVSASSSPVYLRMMVPISFSDMWAALAIYLEDLSSLANLMNNASFSCGVKINAYSYP